MRAGGLGRGVGPYGPADSDDRRTEALKGPEEGRQGAGRRGSRREHIYIYIYIILPSLIGPALTGEEEGRRWR